MIQYNRDRATVVEPDIHSRAKDTGGNGQSGFLNGLDEHIIESFGLYRFHGFGESRSPPFAGISVKCKLGDNHNIGSHIGRRQVHLAVRILEDAEIDNLVGKLETGFLFVTGL